MGKFFSVGIISMALALFASCEDQGVLKSDRSDFQSSLHTTYVDTFLLKTSTILVDSLPTSGNKTILVGCYQDNLLGEVLASSYFQVSYYTSFPLDKSCVFDSIGLILPYSHYYYGDTTIAQSIQVFQVTSVPQLRASLPFQVDENQSYFLSASSMYNTSEVQVEKLPLVSKTLSFYPHRDSVYIELPDALGKKWFDLAMAESISSAPGYFSNSTAFVNDFFKGIYLTSTKGAQASIAGFVTSKAKVRIYYKKLVGDLLKQVHFDFPLTNENLQFNNIKSDRSTSALATLKNRQSISSVQTNNSSYVQSGVGLATKVDFPYVKNFFSQKKGIVVLDATLEIVPIKGSYSRTIQAPATLALYTTDQSNVILSRLASYTDASSFLTAQIYYDYEFGVNTKYSFPLTSYLSQELTTSNATVRSVAIASPPSIYLKEVNRVVLGNQYDSQHKIKLKIYYSYVPNQ